MLSIRAEPSAGATIEEAAREAVRLANLLRVMIVFDFNDVHCVALANGSAEQLAEEIRAEQQTRKKFKFASSG